MIEKAFRELKICTTDQDARDFLSTTLGDVWAAVHKIEEEQGKRMALQNMRRVESFLKSFESFSKTIEILCQGFPPMSFVWVRSVPSVEHFAY